MESALAAGDLAPLQEEVRRRLAEGRAGPRRRRSATCRVRRRRCARIDRLRRRLRLVGARGDVTGLDDIGAIAASGAARRSSSSTTSRRCHAGDGPGRGRAGLAHRDLPQAPGARARLPGAGDHGGRAGRPGRRADPGAARQGVGDPRVRGRHHPGAAGQVRRGRPPAPGVRPRRRARPPPLAGVQRREEPPRRGPPRPGVPQAAQRTATSTRSAGWSRRTSSTSGSTWTEPAGRSRSAAGEGLSAFEPADEPDQQVLDLPAALQLRQRVVQRRRRRAGPRGCRTAPHARRRPAGRPGAAAPAGCGAARAAARRARTAGRRSR